MINTNTKYFNRFLLAFSNVSRGVFTSFFGLIVNYLLLNFKSNTILDSYVYCIAIVNLLLALVNWGGKDYALKTLVAHPHNTKQIVQDLVSSRLLLFFPLLLIFLFIPIELDLKLFIIFYLFLKMLTTLFESLIALRKKFHAFLFTDLFLSAVLVFLLLFDNNVTSPLVFLMELLAIEFLKFVVAMFFFRDSISLRFSLHQGYILLVASRYFFCISLAAFICSKADLYVVGLLLQKHDLSRYFIILNLVGLSQVCYATLISTFSSNIFRYNEGSFAKFSKLSQRLGVVFAMLSSSAIYFICNYYYKIHLDFIFITSIILNILFFTLVLTQMYHYSRSSEQKKVILALLVSSAINIFISLLLTKNFGMIGAFSGNTAGLACTWILLKWILNNGKR